VERALEDVRPYLGSHGGDVELVGVTEDGVVRLRMLGSCDGCASSSVTLKLAVEGAVEAAAPEITGIEVDTAPGSGGGVIPVSALRARLDDAPVRAGWEPVPDAAAVASGEVRGLLLAGVPVVVGRVGTDLYAYRDGCPRCGSGLAESTLERRLGGSAGDAVLRCPACRAHYDVRRAGTSLDDEDAHLEPLPLLVRDGIVSIAVPEPAGGVGA
jgi:Fe-S cluster biogenesis protein NfuA/nitrite reductase/ring-hydroxylating ferredoxin subunit